MTAQTRAVARAILLGLPFENRHDEDKALERTERNDCGKGIVHW